MSRSKRWALDKREPMPVRAGPVCRYPHVPKIEKAEPKAIHRPVQASIRQSGSGVIVTDWRGKEHHFESAMKGLEYAASLYATKPKKPVYRDKPEPAARWGRTINPLTWHAERGNMFSRGPASPVRIIKQS